VNEKEFHSQRAQTQRAARETVPLNDRLSFSPGEFAALNGKSCTWGYRRIYNGDVKVIADAGRLLIPRSEVEKFLAKAAQYNPQAKSTTNEKTTGGEA
jgi:hypothetical protein